MEFRRKILSYPILFWRPYVDILGCWIVISLALVLCVQVSWWFYPVALVLIANRLLALSLVCHEGLHGTLSRNRRLNDFLGRYLCAFPTMISFSRYRRLHLLHHGTVGSGNWDPDRHLYSDFPEGPWSYLSSLFIRVVTFKNSWSFMQYYTDIPEILKVLLGQSSLSRIHKSSDWKSFFLFHLVFLTMIFTFNYEGYFVLFYLIPVTFVMQPYVILMGGLQHGPARNQKDPGGASRSIVGSSWYMWLLLPLDINYHAEHHHNPEVPHYWLRDYARDLQKSGESFWHESYVKALKSLFSR